MKVSRQSLSDPQCRQGTVLLLVLIVVMMLSYSLYSFSERMLVQYEATQSSLTQLQLRQLAESGIVAASDALQNHRDEQRSMIKDDAGLFRHVEVASTGGASGMYSVIPQLPGPSEATAYGLMDESSRLNLNGLSLRPEDREAVRERLIHLPRMTKHIADAILDWMDRDDEPSEYGAESSWYLSQSPPRRPRQGRIESLQELLLVRGVTRDLLFGEDANQNGILDPNENDGSARLPVDNADGRLQTGWSEFLTVHSAESTHARDGARKLNVNSSDLATLYDDLERKFDQEVARFVVALRMAGPADESSRRDRIDDEAKRQERLSSAQRRIGEQLGSGDDDAGGLAALAESGSVQTQRRAGILITSRPVFRVGSLVDLIGTSVRIDVDGVDTLLKSPWQSDVDSVARALRELSPYLTTTSQDRWRERINFLEASYETLMTVPGMSESLARAIVRTRPDRSILSRERRDARSDSSVTSAWLMEQGLVDLRRLRKFAPYVTARGDVFRGVAVGHIDGVRGRSVIRFLIDATGAEPRILSLQDLPPMPLRIGRENPAELVTR